MSEFKNKIKTKKMPDKVTNSPEWNIFLKFVDKRKFKNKTELSRYLDTEIQKRRNWLVENRTNQVSSQRREKTRELEMMDVFRIKILPYL